MEKNIGDLEMNLENSSVDIADTVAPLHRRLAPDCFNNMALFSKHGCRVGNLEDNPYSGVTCVMDFCAHAHEDDSNMIGGCTAIVTLR